MVYQLGKVYGPAQICRVFRVRSTGACAGIFSNAVFLVIADIILKRVANYIYIPIYLTISTIPTTLRYSPLLPVSENGRVEIITTDQSAAAFGLNPAEVSGFCKSALANSPTRVGCLKYSGPSQHLPKAEPEVRPAVSHPILTAVKLICWEAVATVHVILLTGSPKGLLAEDGIHDSLLSWLDQMGHL